MDYIIAQHKIRLTNEGSTSAFARALRPFIAPETNQLEPILELETGCDIRLSNYDYTELNSFDFDDADADCHFGRYTEGYIFRMAPRNGDAEIIFINRHGSTYVRSNIEDNVSMLRFGLWMMFGLALNPLHTIAIHSSVIGWGDGAVMFLGESGTGKSTHTRLWGKHIAGATLLNDDSPIVGMVDGVPTVFGSPWSGKAPCYKNQSYPIRAIVRLSQAPHNKIYKLPTILAIGALLPSCPPAFAYDDALQDNICATLSEVIASVPVYHLECLPDEAAAKLSFVTVFKPTNHATGK
ncbi:MAG: hypothetical protein RR221_05130 [Alistipes sp.]